MRDRLHSHRSEQAAVDVNDVDRHDRRSDGSTPRRNVAVFIDLENLFGGYAGGVSGVPMSRMLKEIEAKIEGLGFGYKAAATRAYANWGHAGMTIYRREVLENGVEPVQIFSYEGPRRTPGEGRRKNAADIQLVVDALTVAGDAPWVDVFVIVSGDGDFVPLVRRLQYLDKFVLGVSVRNGAAGSVSALFRSVVDDFLEVDAATPTVVVELLGSDAVPQAIDESRASAPTSPPSNEIPTLEEYVAAAKEIAGTIEKATKEGAVDGAVVYPILRQRWPRVTYIDLGYKSFGDFIENACGLSIYHPAHARDRELVVAGPTAAPGDLLPALENVAPPITYPTMGALERVLDELTLLSSALPPDQLIDHLGIQLADVPAEQVRLALSLLFSVGAFMELEDDGFILSSDVRSVDEGTSLVLEDAKRRVATLGSPINDDELKAVIFPTS
jgi:uncharacterized LabA/DUF88 family protein